MRNAFVDKLRGLLPLGAEDIAVLEEATAQSRKLPRRHDLIREGDRPGPVFIMLEGWACRYKILPNGMRQVMAFLLPGDSCDLHVSVLGAMDHGIQTITPALVATIPQEIMAGMIDRHPQIARALYIAQLIDEGTLRGWIVSIGRRTSIERVAHLTSELYLRARDIGLTEKEQLLLPVTQAMLADALGMTPVHINRVIKVLRDAGAMTLGRGSLQIADPGKLARIAGFDENYLHRRMRAAA